MNILISADMEGISGIAHWDQVTPGDPNYLSRFRQFMTADVNAAVEGAFEGGATDVVVTDSHWHGTNILIEELDPRVRLQVGLESPYAMLQGIEAQVVGLVCVGYHAMSGTPDAICEHTWSLNRVHTLRVNGVPYGEIAFNAALAGHFGVPVVALSGDQAAVHEALEFLGPDLETAVVKFAVGQQSAECLPLLTARERITRAVRLGVERVRRNAAPREYRLPGPIEMEVAFRMTRFADRAALMPGCERLDGWTVGYVASDILEAHRAFRVLVAASRD